MLTKGENVGRKFQTGQIVITAGVMETFNPTQRLLCLHRHSHCDWGDLDDGDWAINDLALKTGDRILSNYTLRNGRLWIITDPPFLIRPPMTMLMLPEEY